MRIGLVDVDGRNYPNLALIVAAPEMYRDLHEATYERCCDCPARADGDELVCNLADGGCFVQRWLKTLKNARGEE